MLNSLLNVGVSIVFVFLYILLIRVFIERIDDDEIKNIRGYVPTVISHIILND